MNKSKKIFTNEDLEKAINLALRSGDATRARVEGRRDFAKATLKALDKATTMRELKNDAERLDFVFDFMNAMYLEATKELKRIDEEDVLASFYDLIKR